MKMNGINLKPDGRTMEINISLQNQEIYNFLKEADEQQRPERLLTALQIGVIGLRRMDVGEDMDYVEKEFSNLLQKFEGILDPSRENTPVSKLRNEILDEVRKLRDIIIKKEAQDEIISSTPLKGYNFEEKCEEVLNNIVKQNIGDELEKVTNQPGQLIGCKAGDFLLKLRENLDKKIVFETKDVDNISQPKIFENLEKAISNRGATYGVFVAKYKESLPQKIGFFNEYRGNMLVIALGSKSEDTFFPELILALAYHWIKMRLKTDIKIEKNTMKILDEGIKKISEKIQVFSQIQRQCCNIEKASGEIRTYTEELKNDIGEQIQKIQTAIYSDLMESGK